MEKVIYYSLAMAWLAITCIAAVYYGWSFFIPPKLIYPPVVTFGYMLSAGLVLIFMFYIGDRIPAVDNSTKSVVKWLEIKAVTFIFLGITLLMSFVALSIAAYSSKKSIELMYTHTIPDSKGQAGQGSDD